MNKQPSILLFVGDQPVLSSLEFALALDGFEVAEGAGAKDDILSAGCLVVDQNYRGDGADFLAGLRQDGCSAPAVLLVTNPTSAFRLRAAAAGAAVIEKPLLGEELSHALRGKLDRREAA